MSDRAALRAVAAIQTFRPVVGGAELQLERLLSHLADRGVHVEVITRAVRGHPRREEVAGAPVRRTPVAGESPLASIVYVVAALAHLARHRAAVDVVHAHGALSPGTIALGARALGLPCVVTALGTGASSDLARLAGKPAGRLRARLLVRWARFVALSAEAGEELRARGVPPERILTIPNGVDCDVHRPATALERARLREALGLSPDRFVGAFVGRLHPFKDVDTLLAVAARVPALELLIVGDGAERGRLERLAASLGVRARFVGSSPRVADYLRASDAFLLSSHGEGMSNALLEAMACGLPCVATAAVGGVGELLGDGRGMVVPEGDVAGWAEAVERLAGEPALRAALGDAARRLAVERFSLGAAADRLAGAYAAVAGVETVARPTVLYVVSRFPKVTETFVVNEWLALSDRFRMELAALRRTGQAPVHHQPARVRFLGAAHPATVAAHAAWLRAAPRTYLRVLRAVVRGSPRQALEGAAVFHKAARLARIAARENVAHVHAHFANHPATAAWIVHRLTGIPFSFTAHANDLFVRPALLERKVADARFVAAVSEHNRRVLRDRCPGAGRVEVVHCGVDPDRFAPAAGGTRDRERILCVASLEPKKGHVHLVEAFAQLAPRHPGMRVELIGDGPRREAIVRRAHDLGVAGRVHLRGARSADGVRAALAAAGVFVLPSVRMPSGRMEGIPVALMEAMASGVPVVATRLSGIPELVEDGVTGLLVEPGDARALAAAVERIVADATLAAGLARRARERVVRDFDLETQAQRLGDLFSAS